MCVVCVCVCAHAIAGFILICIFVPDRTVKNYLPKIVWKRVNSSDDDIMPKKKKD